MPLYRGARRLVMARRIPAVVVAAGTTWNPSFLGSGLVLSGGNLIVTQTGALAFNSVGAIATHSTGKFYAELTVTASAGFLSMGMANASFLTSGSAGGDPNSVGILFNGNININGATVSATGLSIAGTGQVIGIAVDIGAQLIWFRVSGGTWNNSGTADPATGVGGASLSTLNAGPYFIVASMAQTSDTYTANFGGSTYANTAPSGFGNW